jgi:SlyX protein
VAADRFEDLEVRIAYQDQMLNELNDVVTRQQATITRLEQRYELLLERVRSLGDRDAAVPPGDEKPPHY